MATKKAAERSALAPVAKVTKTQIVKAMAEKLESEPKQVQSFFDALDGDKIAGDEDVQPFGVSGDFTATRSK